MPAKLVAGVLTTVGLSREGRGTVHAVNDKGRHLCQERNTREALRSTVSESWERTFRRYLYVNFVALLLEGTFR